MCAAGQLASNMHTLMYHSRMNQLSFTYHGKLASVLKCSFCVAATTTAATALTAHYIAFLLYPLVLQLINKTNPNLMFPPVMTKEFTNIRLSQAPATFRPWCRCPIVIATVPPLDSAPTMQSRSHQFQQELAK